jgi:glucoamylase
MDVPEQAVLGNNRMLATIGKHGELRYLFWPTIDYPQHVRGSLPGIFYSFKGENRFDWLTDPAWAKKQEYLPDTNIVRTFFRHQNNPDLNITLTDAVLPDSDALIRQFVIQNVSDDEVFLRLFYYNDLAISESPIDDAACYLADDDTILHYKRNFHFAYTGTLLSSGHQCGVHGENSDSFRDVYDSKLSGGSLTLYDGSRDVNSCLSWDIPNLRTNETKTLAVIIAMTSTEQEALEILGKCKNESLEKQISGTEEFWKEWIANFKTDNLEAQTASMTKRSLLTLKLLTVKRHGGIIAAPCMDPEYRFCWPRDATYVAYTFDRCGYHEEAKHFYTWCTKAQEPEGGLYQRYYIGVRLKGPCWSSQIDEIATVLWGMGKHFELTGDRRFVRSVWNSVRKAADFLAGQVSEADGLVETVGLWEEKFGGHTYSNAAVYAGLKSSVALAKVMGKDDLGSAWDQNAVNLRESLLNLSWDAHLNRFIKTAVPRDENLDISLLSLSYPFDVLPADDERIKKTALAIESAFKFKSGGLGRYPFDDYYGGNPWILTTLWLALYYEKVGELGKAEQLIRWALDHSTELGLLSEQVDKENGVPISAIPLAWSHAFFILSVLDLEEAKNNIKQKM